MPEYQICDSVVKSAGSRVMSGPRSKIRSGSLLMLKCYNMMSLFSQYGRAYSHAIMFL